MKIRNIFKKLTNVRKRYIVAVVTGLAIALPIAANAAWGPGRPVWDWNDPSQRVGSLTGPVFNSFINTPTYGDERNLTSVSQVGSGNWTDNVNAQPGDEVEVHVFVHNNANESTNASGLGISHNTKVEVFLPDGVGSGFDVGGYISADNATPHRVYDTANIRAFNKDFSIKYVPGSAKIYNNGPWSSGIPLSDDVIKTGGTPIGYNALNGELPGCFQFSATVTIRVKLVAPKLEFNKQVTTPGSSGWKKEMVVKLGDTDSWLLSFKDTGNDTLKHVVLKDTIPEGLTLVPGSITWFDTAHPNGQVLPDDALSSGGIDLGNYAPAGAGYVRFRTTVDRDFDFNKVACKLTNVATARANYVPEISSSASVKVDVNGNGDTSDDCKEQKAFSCDLLNVKSLGNREFRYTVKFTAQNVTFKSATFNFGDGTTPLTTDKTTVDYKYAKAGTFSTKVNVTFDVNGGTETVTSASCATTISTTTPPRELPDTGAGGVIGIFSAVTVAGALFHRRFLAKRV